MSKLERCLSAEADDDTGDSTPVDAGGLLGSQDPEDILPGQGLEIEPVRGVVVSRDRLWIAVDHDRLEASRSKCH